MPYLHIYFNDALKSVIELKTAVTTIGRAADNAVVIDNAGVSGYHARITEAGGEYAIEDTGSRNGVFVNGKRIDRQKLSYGDAIVVFKHMLKFSAIGAGKPVLDAVSEDTHAIDQGATVMVNTANLDELLKNRQNGEAYLLPMSGHSGGHKLMLTKSSFSLGKSSDADLHIGGWFAPKQAAKIVRHSDGYYLAPEKSGKVRLNGSSVSKSVKLHNGDEFVVRGTALKFINRPSS
jgi:pSer/pThr/pTyr-binding forkhead associated (FHA) protein